MESRSGVGVSPPSRFDPGSWGDPAGRASGAFGRLRLARPDATCSGSRYNLRQSEASKEAPKTKPGGRHAWDID
jgi:hypothetical protein